MSANPLGESAQQLKAILTDGTGLDVRTSARELHPPCLWLTPVGFEFDTMGGDSYLSNWELFIVDLPNDEIDSMDRMFKSAKTLCEVMPDAFDGQGFEVVSINLPNVSADPIPGLSVKFTIREQ